MQNRHGVTSTAHTSTGPRWVCLCACGRACGALLFRKRRRKRRAEQTERGTKDKRTGRTQTKRTKSNDGKPDPAWPPSVDRSIRSSWFPLSNSACLLAMERVVAGYFICGHRSRSLVPRLHGPAQSERIFKSTHAHALGRGAREEATKKGEPPLFLQNDSRLYGNTLNRHDRQAGNDDDTLTQQRPRAPAILGSWKRAAAVAPEFWCRCTGSRRTC